jgi:hypothetical protein
MASSGTILFANKKQYTEGGHARMKYSRSAIQFKAHKLPVLRFEDQRLTSFSGLVVLQALFLRLQLKERLRACFRQLARRPIFGHATIVLQLVVHLLLGYRELRDSRYYRDDPLVKRVLGLKRLPDVATISRALAQADERSVENLRRVVRELVLERLAELGLCRVSLDFDGSVLSTHRRAEGTAAGYNKKKKGARSYYPLFCTLAQTGQVFDVLHRSGNVHDSNGARAFILACIGEIRRVLPRARIEVRMDAAFFSDEIVRELHRLGIEFTISVPFERFTALKAMIEGRQRWRRFNNEWSYFETPWKPKVWDRRFRFVFVRKKVKQQQKGPVQLDLFIPYEYGYQFKVIVTNKQVSAKKLLAFHNGRGSQEGILGELKSQVQADYVPVRGWLGNRIWLLAGMLAHNVVREMQMVSQPLTRGTTEKRATLWIFEQVGTLRRNLLQRAGRLTSPQGQLTLTMSANRAVKDQMLQYLRGLTKAA